MTVSVKPLPELEKRKLSLLQQQQHNFAFGAEGEQRAQTFLVNNNFHIIDTNVRFGTHEIDIIALDQTTNELVFVEVKTRSTDFFGDPSGAVSKKKIASMQVVARQYLKNHPFAGDFRFDVIALLPNSIEHFENVTW